MNKVEYQRPPSGRIAIGQFYERSDEVFILSASGGVAALLLCLNDGEPWSSCVPVNNRQNITPEEFGRICSGEGGDFTRITSPITITPEA